MFKITIFLFRLKIELSTYCTPPFYLLLEETCGKFCQKRNNQFGHYNCTSNGDKECLPGEPTGVISRVTRMVYTYLWKSKGISKVV